MIEKIMLSLARRRREIQFFGVLARSLLVLHLILVMKLNINQIA